MADEKDSGLSISTSQWVSVCQLPGYHRQVHTAFEEMIHKAWGHQHWHPAVDVIETADSFVVEIDLPGVDPQEVKLTFANDRLEVEGRRPIDRQHLCPVCIHSTERPSGVFHCDIKFPPGLDGEAISSTHKNGVLTVHLPKK
ncbi:MAG: hypothetical protein A2Y07_01835 [Planctomycetes bacterium GWF2_50_10]|nr:MAG: hypothetical protein A2Y07_01835 [Planctomycetes bacterium GWF2_50_10]